MGYSPWGGKESDTTERLSTAHLLTIRDSTVIKQGGRTETLALKRPITESWSISYLSDVLMQKKFKTFTRSVLSNRNIIYVMYVIFNFLVTSLKNKGKDTDKN